MRKRLVDSMVLSATMMMMLSLIPIVLVRAVAGPEIYLDPAANDFGTNTTSPCYEWSITIWIRNLTTPVYAWQVLLQIQGVPLDWINMTEPGTKRVTRPTSSMESRLQTAWLYFATSKVTVTMKKHCSVTH